jgi:hypothetical protein
MKLKVDNELLGIFKEIIHENLTIATWSEIESDDQFQTENFCGGFDATDGEFTFSYFDENKTEYWFQKSLEDIQKIVEGEITELPIRPAE